MTKPHPTSPNPGAGSSRQMFNSNHTDPNPTDDAPTPSARPPSLASSPTQHMFTSPPSTPAYIPDTTLEQGAWRGFYRPDSPHPRYTRVPLEIVNSSPELDMEDAEVDVRVQIFQRNARRLQREANENDEEESGPEGDQDEGMTELSGSSAFATPTDFDSQVSVDSEIPTGRLARDPITNALVYIRPPGWALLPLTVDTNDNDTATETREPDEATRPNLLPPLDASLMDLDATGNASPTMTQGHNPPQLDREDPSNALPAMNNEHTLFHTEREDPSNALPAMNNEYTLSHTDREDSGNALPTMTREQSLPHSASMSTIIQTPSRRSKSLPSESPDDPSLPLGQRLWRLRSIRKRIISFMDMNTAATMCRVNRRMYSQCVPIIAESVESSYVVTEELLELTGRRKKFYRSVQTLCFLQGARVIMDYMFEWFPNSRCLILYNVLPDGTSVPSTSLYMVKKVNRRSGRTFTLVHLIYWNINQIIADPPPPTDYEMPREWHVVHRYGLILDLPLFDTSPQANFTDLSPLGDRIWAICTNGWISFEYAYQHLQKCVDKRRCQRRFEWTYVTLYVWRITVMELEAIVQLLQASHLDVENLDIRTYTKDAGSCSTYDIAMGGPRLWRLFQKFKCLSLDLRHDKFPIPSPGRGPKGLQMFGKYEMLNLRNLTIFATLTDEIEQPLYAWKGTYDIIFGWFCQTIASPQCVISIQVRYPLETTTRVRLEREFEICDLSPFWDQLDKSCKGRNPEEILWEWEHGTLPSKKKKAVGWSKVETKKPRSGEAEIEGGARAV